MSTILVLDTNILAVNPQDAGDTWATPDQIIPKRNVEGAQVIDVALPDDYAPGRYRYEGSTFIAIPPRVISPTKEELLAQIVALQQKALRALVEDAPDTTWLDKYRAQIAALRSQLK